MRKTVISLTLLLAVLIIISPSNLLGYGNVTSHPRINAAICKAFEKTFISKLDLYPKFENVFIEFENGFKEIEGPYVYTGGNFVIAEDNNSITAYQWIIHGGYSADEPEVPASVRHFYDPLGLRDGKKYLTNRGTYWEGRYPNPGIDAIEWAIGDTEKGEGNLYTWEAGKFWFKKALETKDDKARDGYLARAFRSLGEVLHNTADMGCPSHVRNDSHAAPLGLGWGWIIGSPDPYEEIMVEKLEENSPYFDGQTDPALLEFVNKATTARSINEYLAGWTNKNFFTHETISGTANGKVYNPVNGEKAYPSPKLESLVYDSKNYTFTKKFPSGRTVKMCKDFTYRNLSFRGQPYIDEECTVSQAQELMPAIVAAGKNIIRLFVPDISIELKNNDMHSDTIKVQVKHKIDEEYKYEIKYEGRLTFWVNGKLVFIKDIKDPKWFCDKGEYINAVINVKNGDKVRADIHFSDFLISSKDSVIIMDPFWGNWKFTQTFVSTDEPKTSDTPKPGDVFTGDRFMKPNHPRNGYIDLISFADNGKSTMHYERSGNSCSFYGESATLKLNYTGSMNSSQDKWTGTLKREYKSTIDGKWYTRNYTLSATRIPYEN